ncbi:MAG TPA: hypothetical protein VKX49_25780 [Bryobacteraceae bacterium]|nr:hypothetical protein [Bryobacteraceae bacterium]
MPYCCHCGQKVGTGDQYCANCGAAQPNSSPVADYIHGISPRTASLLCYIPIVGWIVAIVVLASARFRDDTRVRFNAFQGLYLFVAWLIVDWVLGPIFSFPHMWGLSFYRVFPALLKAGIFAAWIVMIVKTAQDELYKLPILGELAEKSVSEQR